MLMLSSALVPSGSKAQDPTGIPFQFPVAGTTVRGHVYRSTVPGPRPTIIELKGFEQDSGSVAPSAPLHGYNGVSFDFRGQNSSDGEYSPGHTQQDLAGLINFLRSDRARIDWKIDPAKLIVVGTSAGSFATLTALADDPALKCGAVVVPFNWGFAGTMIQSDAAVRSEYDKIITGANPRLVRPVSGLVSLAADSAAKLNLDIVATRLRGKVVFLVGAQQDQVAPLEYNFHPLVAAVRAAGAATVRDTLVNDSHNLPRTEAAVTAAVWRWVRSDCLGKKK